MGQGRGVWDRGQGGGRGRDKDEGLCGTGGQGGGLGRDKAMGTQSTWGLLRIFQSSSRPPWRWGGDTPVSVAVISPTSVWMELHGKAHPPAAHTGAESEGRTAVTPAPDAPHAQGGHFPVAGAPVAGGCRSPALVQAHRVQVGSGQPRSCRSRNRCRLRTCTRRRCPCRPPWRPSRPRRCAPHGRPKNFSGSSSERRFRS